MPKKTKKAFLFIITLFVISVQAIADSGNAGEYGSYLRTGVGARPLAMGGAYVAISDDIYASYWNPSGLMQLKSKQIGSMYAKMSFDRTNTFVSYAQPLNDKWSAAVSWLNFGVNNIEERDNGGFLLGETADSESSIFISAARKINTLISVGANLKYLTHFLAGKNAKGYGADISALALLQNNICIGFIVQDIGSQVTWNTESGHKDTIPQNIRLGVSKKIMNNKLLTAFDIEKNQSQSMKYHMGGEYLLNDKLCLRAGYNDGELAAGVGLSISKFRFDFGLNTDKTEESNAYRISILYSF